MWPLASAKTASVSDSRSRWSSVSRTHQGSTGYSASVIDADLGQVAHHDVGSGVPERRSVVHPVHPHHPTEVTPPPGDHAGNGVLEHGRRTRRHAQSGGGGEVAVGRRLAGEVLFVDRHTV